jgi:hypothetical protein
MELLTIALGGGMTVAVVSGIVQIVIWRLNRKATVEDRKGNEDKEVRAALRLILYDRIKYLGRKYIAAESITFDELEDLNAMHKCYSEGLGGNGTLDGLMVLVRTLLIKA